MYLKIFTGPDHKSSNNFGSNNVFWIYDQIHQLEKANNIDDLNKLMEDNKNKIQRTDSTDSDEEDVRSFPSGVTVRALAARDCTTRPAGYALRAPAPRGCLTP